MASETANSDAVRALVLPVRRMNRVRAKPSFPDMLPGLFWVDEGVLMLNPPLLLLLKVGSDNTTGAAVVLALVRASACVAV